MNGGTDMQNDSTGKENADSPQAQLQPQPALQPTFYRDKNDRLIIHIPMTFKKRCGRKEIVLPPGHRLEDHQDGPSINKPLALAMALGHRWLDLLVEGQYGSVGELAEAIKIDPSQLRRYLTLTCVSPRLTRAIMDGKEPSGVSVGRLKDVSGWWEAPCLE
jgi:hypothetical protein